MEYYQAFQNRTAQTVSVVQETLPGLTVGGVDAVGLLAASTALNALAQTRDDALSDFDAANNVANLGFLAIRAMVLALPLSAQGELGKAIPEEAGLLNLLLPAFAIRPRRSDQAVERGRILVSAITRMNAYLGGLPVPRAPITSGGNGVAELIAALASQPANRQAEKDRAADVRTARSALRQAATDLDSLNKRFYARLRAEARTQPALAAALGQIATESSNLPSTLGISTILQGGSENLQLLVSYDGDSFHDSYKSTLEWQVVGADMAFTHSHPAVPGGNALGPFAVGEPVKVRTRASNGNGTTTGSVRTLTLVPP